MQCMPDTTTIRVSAAQKAEVDRVRRKLAFELDEELTLGETVARLARRELNEGGD